MGHWDEKFRQHGVFRSLPDFGARLDECFSVSDDPVAAETLMRLKAVLAFVGKRLEIADPLFVPKHPLNVLMESFNSAFSQLGDFKSDAAVGHLDTASQQLDEALRVLSEIPSVVTSEDIGVIAAAATQYRDELVRLEESGRGTIRDFGLHAGVLESRMNVSTAESQRKLSDLQADVTSLKERVDKMVFDFQHDYSEATTSRQNEFNALIAKFGTDFVDLRDIHRNDFKHLEKELDVQSSGLVQKIDKLKGEAETLVGIIGNLGMTSGFQKAAKTAWDETKKWQHITIAAIIALVVTILVTFLTGSTIANDWPNLVGRILLSLAFAALAKYAGTQSDKNFQIFRMNSRWELELQALGPYLAPLQTEEQHKFRIYLANKVFGQDDTSLQKNGWSSPTNIVDILTSEDARSTLREIAPHLAPAIPEMVKAWSESLKASRPKRWFWWN